MVATLNKHARSYINTDEGGNYVAAAADCWNFIK